MSKQTDWKIWIDKKLEKQDSLAWGSIQKSFKKDFPQESDSKELKTFVWNEYNIIPEKKTEQSRISKKTITAEKPIETIGTYPAYKELKINEELLESPERYKGIFSKDFLNIIDTATNKVINVAQGHPHFYFLQELFKAKDYQTMFELSDPVIFITENLKEFITHRNNIFYLYQGDKEYEIPAFKDIIKDLCFDIDSYKNLDFFKKFIVKLLSNESISELPYFLLYLSMQKFIINEEGNIIGYKAVRKDLYDKYSSSIKNNVGATIRMPRDKVTQDRNQTCSAGLHVGNLDYINHYWDRASDVLLAVEIEPQDLVSVPGTNEGKIRVCKYRVLCKMDFQNALRKNKFLSTASFIEQFSISENIAIETSNIDFESWIDKKLEKLGSITWGGLRKAFNKTFSNFPIATFKKFVDQNYSVIHEKKSENSKIRKK